MILATVGTHAQPFPRFFALVRQLGDEVVVQYGHNPRPEGFARAEPFVSFGELATLMESARAVVTHAGVGSILSARRAGHVPVVVPRLHRLGEHVDDHQAELTRTLEATGEVVAAWSGEGLPALVEQATTRRGERPPPGSPGPLHEAVRAALLGGVG